MSQSSPSDTSTDIEAAIERMADCIGESKSERRDDTSMILDDLKRTIEAILTDACTRARIDELEMVTSLTQDCSCHFCEGDYLDARIRQLHKQSNGEAKQ